MVQRRIAIAQLAGIFDFDRQPGKGLDLILAHQAGVPTGAAAGDDDAVERAKLLRRVVEAAELRRGGVAIEPASHDVFDRLGLLEDFLEHEVLEAALGDVAGLKIEHVNAVVDVALVAMNDPQAVGGDDGQLVIGQIDDLVGETGQGRGVAGDEMFAGADADDQRASEPGGDQHLGPLAEENRQAVGSLELRQGGLDGGDQRLVADGRHVGDRRLALQATVDQMGDHLGIGRRLEDVSLALEALFDGLEVLDDAVMDQGQRAVAAHMGVCVNIAGGSVGSPAGVADADMAGDRVCGQEGFEPVDSAGGFDDGELAVGRDGGHAGAVVAAVFQAVEPHEQEFGCIARSNIPNDPAHRLLAPQLDR